MPHRALPFATLALLALLVTSLSAAAADVGQHPAIFSPRSLPGIDASTFIVGHPAGGAPGQAEPEVGQHPAQVRSAPDASPAKLTRDRPVQTSSR